MLSIQRPMQRRGLVKLTKGMGWKSALRMRSNMSCIRFTP